MSSESYCSGRGKRQIEILPDQIDRCALAMATFADKSDPDCALIFVDR